GTVDAWADLHKKFGKLKLSDDLAPAIHYAEEGFPVTELIAYYWALGPRLYKSLPGAFLETYTLDGKGRTPAKGDIFKNPALAKFYADPAFAKIPVTQLISKQYAAERRKLIDPQHAARQIEPGNPALDRGDTIYMCAADDEGNLVSLIQSNYRGMGSGIVVPGLGFMFQDRGELFSMDPQHANVYAPGKRSFHTIIPGFVMKDGKPWE